MRSTEVDKALRVLQSQLEKRKMLAPGSEWVLWDAIEGVSSTYSQYCDSKRSAWGCEISSQRPLKFKKTKVNGYSVQADLFCSVEWQDPDEPPKNYRLVLRVWASDPDVVYRDEIDAPAVEKLMKEFHIQPKRVMCRYHFDRANPGQAGPLHHLQIGGRPDAAECAWLFKGIRVPRLMFPPVDVILATEMVIANFYDPDVGRRILKDPVWTSVLVRSQQEFLEPYYRSSLDLLCKGKESLLMNWWNLNW